MKHIILTFAFASLIMYSSRAQQSKVTTEVLLTKQTLESNIPSSHASKDVSHTYFDGLGRPLQSIAQEVTATTGTSQDIVSFYTYSQVSANPQTFLPYVKTNTSGNYQGSASTEQASFYSNASNGIATDASPKMETVYEKSPLGRVLESGSIGAEWQPGTGHTVRYAYRTNHANEVRLWSTIGISSGFYPQDALWVTEITNENGNKSLVYQDKMGRTLLVKRQLDATISGESVVTDYEETQYVYDQYGRLMSMVPPQAIALMKAEGSWNVDLTSVQELVYTFRYDEFGRLILQKVPGMGWFYTVYDNFHRPILRQDANLRAANKWSFTKYDSYGRVAYEGILTNNTYTSHLSMQAYISGLNYEGGEPYFENRTTSSAFQYYTQQTKPNVTATEVMAYYYYDDHNVNYSGGADAAFKSPAEFSDMPQVVSSLLKGKITAIKKRVVGTSTLLTEYYFYDKYGRNIQVIKNNYLNTASLSDTLSNQFDFSGKVFKTLQKQTVTGVTTTILKRFEYYNQGHLKAVFQKNNADAEQRVAYYNYNKLGQLVEKNLHYKGAGDVALAASYLQSVDYKFNIKGWLTAINSSALTTVTGESADIFGMELFYNTQAGLNTTNTPYYNGNISAVKWKTNDAANNYNPKRERSYRYAYDKHERLSSAIYMAKGTSWNMESGAYNVENIKYDHNGNIKTMDRWTKEDDILARVKVDALSYFYDSNNPNRIKYIEDAGVDTTSFKDFNGSTLEYTYDANGNLLSDQNKGLSFTYNELNKVKKATKDANNYIEYVYDASGVRLQKKAVMGANIVITNYLDGIVYENNTLAWFGMPEGRVAKEGSLLEYQYIISDHQGNSRMMFRAKPSAPTTVEVLQENHYDPYGLPLTGLAINTPIGGKDNKYLYNGPGEWEADLSLNFHNTYFRDYDPAIGRFNGVDPLAASFANESPYVYAGNNPISFNDPLGDKKVAVKEGERESWISNPFPDLAWAMDFHERRGGGGSGPGGGGKKMSVGEFVSRAKKSKHGGHWSNGKGYLFQSQEEGFFAGVAYNNYHNSWRNTKYGSSSASFVAFAIIRGSGGRIPEKEDVENAMNPSRLNTYASIRDLPPPDWYMIALKSYANYLRGAETLGTSPNPFYGAEAIFVDAGASIMGEVDTGIFFILAGGEIGSILSFDEKAGGFAADFGIAFEIGRIDSMGNPNDFSSNYLYGTRNKVFISGGVGISAGVGVAWSSYDGVNVYATSVQIGFGGSMWLFSGGYNNGLINRK